MLSVELWERNTPILINLICEPSNLSSLINIATKIFISTVTEEGGLERHGDVTEAGRGVGVGVLRDVICTILSKIHLESLENANIYCVSQFFFGNENFGLMKRLSLSRDVNSENQ